MTRKKERKQKTPNWKMTENTFFIFLKKYLTSVFCGVNMILLKQNRKGDKKNEKSEILG
jgi:hypothetical protein